MFVVEPKVTDNLPWVRMGGVVTALQPLFKLDSNFKSDQYAGHESCTRLADGRLNSSTGWMAGNFTRKVSLVAAAAV